MAPHITTFRVRFYELDPYGHVNHAEYIRHFEAARVEALEEMGFGIDRMHREGIQIVLVELTARFLAPAGLHDTLTIATSVVDVGRATSRWHQEARRDGTMVAMLDLKAAFTDLEGRPRRTPEEWAEGARLLEAAAGA